MLHFEVLRSIRIACAILFAPISPNFLHIAVQVKILSYYYT